MSDARKQLIEDLVADLRPVRLAGRIGPQMTFWLAAALLYSGTILLATGPLRPGALANLLAFPFFALETIFAVTTIGAFALAALRLAIPGRGGPRQALAWPLALLGAWLAVYVVGLWAPAHPVSPLGVRDHCVWQTVLFSLPNLFVLLLVARRLYPVWPVATAATAGAAGGALPAALMQFGCMYDPAHILTHHMPPIVLIALIGAVAGPFILRRRRVVPRSRGVPIH